MAWFKYLPRERGGEGLMNKFTVLSILGRISAKLKGEGGN